MPLLPHLKGLARAGLFRAGVEVDRFPRTQTLAGLLHTVLRDRRIDTVIDVGANTGQFGRLVRSLGHRGPLVSFEPLAEQAAVLRDTARRQPPWAVHEIALGATAGRRAINVADESMLSSFLPASAHYDELMLDDTTTTAREVRIETLDAVAYEEPLLRTARRILLKTDTQGFDAEVLAGAEATLARVEALQVELSVRPIYDGAPGWIPFLAEIEAKGFALAGMFPANTDRHLRLIDVDAVFVRDTAPAIEAQG